MLIKDKILISVGILTRNKYKSFEKILTNIVGQDYTNLEIIIADNSTKSILPNKIKKIITNDSRIKYYKHPVSISYSANENFIRTKFTGKYACVLHDDDQIPLDYISKLFKKMITSKNCNIVCLNTDRYYNGKFWYSYYNISTTNLDQLNRLIYLSKFIYCGGGFLEHFWNGLYKVSSLPKNFRLKNKLTGSEPILFIFRMAITGNVITLESNNKIIKNTNIANIKKYNYLYKKNKITKFKIINSIYFRLKSTIKIFKIIFLAKNIKLINKLKIFNSVIIFASTTRCRIKEPIKP